MKVNTIQVPDELWLTAISLGGQTTKLDPPVLVHKGTKTLELTQVDGKPFTIQFRVWHPEPEVDAHKMHTDVQNNPDRSQPNEQNPSKINDFPTK